MLPHAATQLAPTGTQESFLVILDAQQLERGPVATLRFRRVRPLLLGSLGGAALLGAGNGAGGYWRCNTLRRRCCSSCLLLLNFTHASPVRLAGPPTLMCSRCPAACTAAGLAAITAPETRNEAELYDRERILVSI